MAQASGGDTDGLADVGRVHKLVLSGYCYRGFGGFWGSGGGVLIWHGAVLFPAALLADVVWCWWCLVLFCYVCAAVLLKNLYEHARGKETAKRLYFAGA